MESDKQETKEVTSKITTGKCGNKAVSKRVGIVLRIAPSSFFFVTEDKNKEIKKMWIEVKDFL